MRFAFRPIAEADAREILAWRYDPPYEFYNADVDQIEEDVVVMLDPENHYYVATAEDEVVGFCCFGCDARVPGGDYTRDGAIDIGLGLRPDLTGHGLGPSFVAAILELGRHALGARAFRMTVAAFNRRAQRAYQRAGFEIVERFVSTRSDRAEFFVMELVAREQPPAAGRA